MKIAEIWAYITILVLHDSPGVSSSIGDHYKYLQLSPNKVGDWYNETNREEKKKKKKIADIVMEFLIMLQLYYMGLIGS